MFLGGGDSLVERMLLRWALRYPIRVAGSLEGYLRNCLVVNAGNVVRKPTEIALSNVDHVGENRLAV